MTNEADQPADVRPAYRLPLSHELGFHVGAFVAIWGQVDYFMGLCIAGLLQIEIGGAQTLMENMTSGPRLNLFYRLARERIKDPEVLEAVKAFYKDASPLIESRNHLMHGMWGWYVPEGSPRTAGKPAVFYPKTPKTPLYLEEQLPKMIERASDLSCKVVSIFQHLFGAQWSMVGDVPSFFFSDGPPPGSEGSVQG